MKIVLSSVIVPNPDLEEEILRKFDYDFVFVPNEDDNRFLGEIEDADAIVIADKKINKDTIDRMKKCKVIVRQGIGFDSIDINYAKEKGISVCNVPDYSIEEVSEFTVALVLNLARHINSYDSYVRKGVWDIQSVYNLGKFPPMRRSSTQTLGIIGLGRIAKLVAKKAKPFGFKIISYDPFVPENIAKELGVTLVSLDNLLQESDFITINVPLNKDTYHLINSETLNKMKETAYLVNTARGPHVCEDDLYDALKNKRIAGAAIDVTENEPIDVDSKLLKLDNLIVTPHAAFFTKDSFEELRRRALEEAIRVLEGKEPINRVNK